MQRITLGAAVTSVVLSLIAVAAIATLSLQQSTLLAAMAQNATTLELVAERLSEPIAADEMTQAESVESPTTLDLRDAPVAKVAGDRAGEYLTDGTLQFPVSVSCKTAAGDFVPFTIEVRRDDSNRPRDPYTTTWQSGAICSGVLEWSLRSRGTIDLMLDRYGLNDLLIKTESGYATRRTVNVDIGLDLPTFDLIVPDGRGELVLRHDFSNFRPLPGEDDERLAVSVVLWPKRFFLSDAGEVSQEATGQSWIFLGDDREPLLVDQRFGVGRLPEIWLIDQVDTPHVRTSVDAGTDPRMYGSTPKPLSSLDLPIGHYEAFIAFSTTRWTPKSTSLWESIPLLQQSRFTPLVDVDDTPTRQRFESAELVEQASADFAAAFGLRTDARRGRRLIFDFEITDGGTTEHDFVLPDGFRLGSEKQPQTDKVLPAAK